MSTPTILNYDRQTPFIYGRIVAWYLIALGLASIGSTIVSAIFFDSLNIDFTFIFLFWAAYGLMKRSAVARKIVMVFSAILSLLIACLIVWKTFVPGGVRIHIGQYGIYDPSPALLLLVGGLMILFVSVPFIVLMPARARREFERIS